MEIVTSRNACRRQLASLFFAFACVATFQPGCGKVQDIDRHRQAAELGDAEAQNKLGFMYARGEGVAEDDQEAAKWFRKAAEQGYAKAQLNLGLSYAKGEGVQEDDQQAVKWFRKAAEQGYAKAQFNLGIMYMNGEGVAEDDQEAVKWYRKAAEQGYARAQFNLGFMHSKGKGVPEDDREVVKWYRKAAEQGYAAAQQNLGFMYWTGEGVAKDDQEAAKWYRKAAEQGYAAAQWGLGGLYSTGNGVPEDDREAAQWFRKAAEQGLVAAQYSLGNSYYRGEGVVEDNREAAKWYRKAAEQGHVTAQFNMGVMYSKGEGLPKDYVTAYAWWDLASAQGNETAAESREQLGATMTTEQVTEAQKLATELLNRNKKHKTKEKRKGKTKTTVEKATVAPTPKQDKIVCNKFTLTARIEGNDLMLAVDTDLPDYAKVAFSVRRIYYEVGNEEAYSHPYFSKTEPVGSWRIPRPIALDAAAWKASLVKHQRKMSRTGSGMEFDIGKIDKYIEVSAFLSALDNDPRLGGLGNPKVVRNVKPNADKKLLFPLAGSYSSLRSKFAAWDNLKVGVKYRLSGTTTVVSAIPGTPEARRNFVSTKLPAGEVIRIYQVINYKNGLFYRAALAEDPGLEFIINSVVLIQQNLQVVQ